MQEAFLHYLWQNRLFYPIGMTTTGGDAVEVVNPGQLNTDGGPDFFNAQVKIGDTLWAGNVEIHLTSSDWCRHGHDKDGAYNNVILHVVGRSTPDVVRTAGGRVVPEVELSYPHYIAERYEAMSLSRDAVRCAPFFHRVTELDKVSMLDRLLLERFEERYDRVSGYLAASDGDWDQAFFILLARAMGFVVNAEPMEHLARITPVRILLKHCDPVQSEALLMGQAGLLPDEDVDDYSALLRREYRFLRAKFGLTPMDGSEWKMFRLRPGNFPLVRLSQLAAIVRKNPGNFESTFKRLDVEGLLSGFQVEATEYWNTHFSFGRVSADEHVKKLGLSSRRLLVVNVVVPFVFAYSRRFGDEHGQRNVIAMMKCLPIEKNAKLDMWRDVGLVPESEGDAQAILLLYRNYCLKRRCLSCKFGHVALSKL